MFFEVSRAAPPARGRLAHNKAVLFPDGRRDLDSMLGLVIRLSNRRRYVAVGIALAEDEIRPRTWGIRRIALCIRKTESRRPRLAPDREDTTNALPALPFLVIDHGDDGVDELTCEYVVHLTADLEVERHHRRRDIELVGVI
eukprot:3644850-Prymnesium_polylepis.1